MCYRFSHHANFQRATYPSSPPTSSTGSPASHHTSWLSSPLCNLHCWELSHRWMFSPMSLRKPEEYENFFFLDTMGMCRMYPVDFFSPPSVFFSFVWYFCPSQKNSGMDQTRISLIWPFLCCISIYWSFILMFGDALKKKSGCLKNKNEWLSGWPFSFICLLLIVILISSQERIIEAVSPQWLKRHFNI